MSRGPLEQAAMRRAALAVALSGLEDEQHAMVRIDARTLDGYVALMAAAAEAGIDETALALCAAEGDESSSKVARALLAAGALVGIDTLDDTDGIESETGAAAVCRLMAAAISPDDEFVVRFLASDSVGLDIAHVRAAAIGRPGEPLRAALGKALDCFPLGAPREAAARAAASFRAVAAAADDEDATLESLVQAALRAHASLPRAAPISRESAVALTAAAAGSDAVWRSTDTNATLHDRARVFCDALLRPGARCAPWPLASPGFMAEGASPAAANSELQRDGFVPDSIAPWEWPQAESPRTVVAPPMTFSASRLNAYVKCSRRWFFEYLCDAVDDPGSIQATYGRVLHEALEALHLRESDFSPSRAPEVLDALLREIDAAFGRSRRAFASPWEYEISRLQARRIAPRYVEWLVEQMASAPSRIVALEAVHRLRAGGHDFVGYIDRIDEPLGGGPVTIYDYKTGRMAEDPRAYLEAVRSGDEAQLPLYYFMCRAVGSDVGRMALVSVRDPQGGIRVLALDIVDDSSRSAIEPSGSAACTRADLDAALGALLRRCDLLTQSGVGHFDVGSDPPCGYCAYAPACREKPLIGESIFAR